MADVTPSAAESSSEPSRGEGVPQPWRPILWAIAAYLGVALYLFQKAIFYKGPRVVGAADTEVYPFLWGFFWIKESILGDGALPYFTKLMDYPVGGVLWVKEQLTGILLLPIQLLFGIPAAYTTAEVLHCVLGGLGVFLVLRQLGVRTLPGILAGLTFGFCPHQLGEAYNGNLDAMNIGWSSLWVASLITLIKGDRWRLMLPSGFVLAALLVSNQYFAIAMAFASIPIALLCLWELDKVAIPPALGRLMGALTLGLLGALPMASTLRSSLKAPNKLHDFGSPATDTAPFLTDLSRYWSPLKDLGEGGSLPFQDLIYPGFFLVFLALLAPALAKGRRRYAFTFLGLGLFFAILAMGPKLYINDHILRSEGHGVIYLPWKYLVSGIPILESMSLPHRMTIPSGLFLSLSAGLSLESLYQRFIPRLGPKLAWGSVFAIGALVFSEMLSFPGYEIPLHRTRLTSPTYTNILNKSDYNGAVLNLPINLFSNDMRVLLWHQTLHKRPIAMSFRIGQWPSVVSQVPFLYENIRALSVEGPPLRNKRPPDPADPLGIAHLSELGFAYVVLHAEWVSLQPIFDLEVWRKVLEDALGPGHAYRDGAVVFPLNSEARAQLELAEAQIDSGLILPRASSWEALSPMRQIGADQLGLPPKPPGR